MMVFIWWDTAQVYYTGVASLSLINSRDNYFGNDRWQVMFISDVVLPTVVCQKERCEMKYTQLQKSYKNRMHARRQETVTENKQMY